MTKRVRTSAVIVLISLYTCKSTNWLSENSIVQKTDYWKIAKYNENDSFIQKPNCWCQWNLIPLTTRHIFLLLFYCHPCKGPILQAVYALINENLGKLFSALFMILMIQSVWNILYIKNARLLWYLLTIVTWSNHYSCIRVTGIFRRFGLFAHKCFWNSSHVSSAWWVV